MITIYTQPGCSRSRRLKRWLKDMNIPYREEQLCSLLLDKQKLITILKGLKNPMRLADCQSELPEEHPGFRTGPSILYTGRQQPALWRDEEYESLADYIKNNPSCLRRPIVTAFLPEDLSLDESEALYRYLDHRDTCSCSSCSMIPVCSDTRFYDKALYLGQQAWKKDMVQHLSEFV